MSQGVSAVRTQLPTLIADETNGVSPIMRRNLTALYESLCFLDNRILDQEKILRDIARENEVCKRLMQVPGIGLLPATILLSVAGVASNFKNGREFAAYLGLVPRQNSTGDKTKLLGISKRGDSYARTLLVHGARAVLYSLIAGRTPQARQNAWLAELFARRGINRTSVALANKTARIAWSMLALGTEYRIAA